MRLELQVGRVLDQQANKEGGFLKYEGLPSCTQDLSLSRQNDDGAGRPAPPSPFRPLSRRSSRIPALLYPPLR